jgi:hypothetical protein
MCAANISFIEHGLVTTDSDMDVVDTGGHTNKLPATSQIGNHALLKNEEDTACSKGPQEHLQIDRNAPLCLGTAIHMATAAVSQHLFKEKGYVYVDTHESGASSMYLNQEFVLENFSAVLRIRAGRLEDFPRSSNLVRSP